MSLNALIGCFYILVIGIATTFAADSAPLLTATGQPILTEDFSTGKLDKPWQPGGKPGAFTIVDGAMQGVCAADDSHGPSIGVPIEAKNLTVQFNVRFIKPGGVLFLVDGDSAFGGQAHLIRVGLSPKQAALQQDRGSLKSKADQKVLKDKAAKEKTKVAPPTAAQLADPSFYRTERIDAKPAKLVDGQWHTVLLEIAGNEVAAQIDGSIVLKGRASVADVKKSRIVFLVGNAGVAQFDNIKVWHNTPK